MKPSTTMIGTQVDQLVIQRLLGRSGRGAAYLADHAVLKPPRAVKVRSPRWPATTATAPAPTPVPTDGPWLIMLDPVEGQTLARLIYTRARTRYRLGPKLGTGGMAEVFQGTVIGGEGFARQVAIKRVLAGHSEAPRFAAMFVDEARIASRLSHPNVVSVLDFDRDDEGRLILVMELIEGKDLEALCAAGRPPPSVAIFVVSEILRGLGYAHELPHAGGARGHVHRDARGDVHRDARGYVHRGARGYVHRDVSPHNVLVSWEGAVKVSDFGIAKALEGTAGTRSAIVKGKPAYMSPEQVNAEALDGRSDLFAVGIILWELLAGTKLFTGGTRETFARILFHDVPPPSRFAARVPADLEAVAMKLLARDREDRYPTAAAAIEALARCADNPRNGRSELARWMARLRNDDRQETAAVTATAAGETVIEETW